MSPLITSHTYDRSTDTDTGAPLQESTRAEIADALERQRPEVIKDWFDAQFDPDRLERFGIAGVDEVDEETLCQRFLHPLLNVLLEFLRTGDSCSRDVYLNERLRYAPHRREPAVRVDFFRELLRTDEEALLARVAAGAGRSELCRVLDELHRPLLTVPESETLRFLALGDCLMGELRSALAGRCRDGGIELDFRFLYFSAQQGKGLSTDQTLRFVEEHEPHLIALSFLSYEGLPFYPAFLKEAEGGMEAREIDARAASIASLMREFLDSIRERTDTPFLLHNASGLPLTSTRARIPFLPPLSAGRARAIEALNREIERIAESVPNTIPIDEVGLVSKLGHRKCSKPLMPDRILGDAFFHPTRFGHHLARVYLDVIESYRVLGAAKVLLVDFDNTLWDGVMADGDVVHHRERQKVLRELKDRGILLVALSKNDPAHVRWEEMELAPEDFVLRKISWNLKPASVAEAAEALDLGLDSFVLLDDNPAERELVRHEHPAVRALDPGEAPTWRSLERMLQFSNTRETEVARNRTRVYREQAERHRALEKEVDYPRLMRTLGLKAHFGPARKGDVERITELVQRTNQFNTTTIRRSRQALHALLESEDHAIYVAEMTDKFGELGLVAVVIVAREHDIRTIDSFILSCRAMGFGLEQLVLGLVLDAERGREPERTLRFVGRFVATDRNDPASGLFEDAGFEAVDEERWVLEPEAPLPDRPEWFTVVERQGAVRGAL